MITDKDEKDRMILELLLCEEFLKRFFSYYSPEHPKTYLKRLNHENLKLFHAKYVEKIKNEKIT